MSDKERILMMIITRIIPGLYMSNYNKNTYIEFSVLNNSFLKKGDLVFAYTTRKPNDFMVGFVEEPISNNDYVVIREIGSKRLCNYYNENFVKINKDYLGYEILEGIQYQTYQKVLKAIEKYSSYWTRFKSISFDEKICIVQCRRAFSENTKFEISFKYNKNTTIKSIVDALKTTDKQLSKKEVDKNETNII